MSEATSSVTHVLGKKLGPLPVGAWAAAIAGGLGISWYLRRNGAAGTTTPNPVEVTDPGTSTDTPAGTGGAATSTAGNANPGNITGPTDPESADPGSISVSVTTNAQWRQQAVKYLVGLGVSGTDAEYAVTYYLAGKPISPNAMNNINRAIAGIGPTPTATPGSKVIQPIKIIPTKPVIKHAPAPKPPKHPKKKHHPVRHKTHPTHVQHSSTAAHPATRRDTGQGM